MSENIILKNYYYTISADQLSPNAPIPFEEHQQFLSLMITLYQKNNPDIYLLSANSPLISIYFLRAFSAYLQAQESIFQSSFYYFDIAHCFTAADEHIFFEAIAILLSSTTLPTIFVFTNGQLLSAQQISYLSLLFHHIECRYIIVTQKVVLSCDAAFSLVRIDDAKPNDILAILKQETEALVSYHHIQIPHEILWQTYLFAERFLSTHNTLDETLALLDSSAARMQLEKKAMKTTHSISLTMNVIQQQLALKLNLPNNQQPHFIFEYNDFIQAMQNQVSGQDAALVLIGQRLLEFNMRLQQSFYPCLAFIFAGPSTLIKNIAVTALTHYLYKQPKVLFFAINAANSATHLDEILFERETDKKRFSLAVIQKETPNAVIVINNIEHLSLNLLEEIETMLKTGYWHQQSEAYLIKHMTFIFFTTLGSMQLIKMNNSLFTSSEENEKDLLQLVMPEKKTSSLPLHLSKKYIEAIRNDIQAKLNFCQYTQIIPFLPLNLASVKSLLDSFLHDLAKTVLTLHQVHLKFTPEVTIYLTQLILAKQDNLQEIATFSLLLKPLFITIEQALISRPLYQSNNRLIIQLNETGELLYCEWLTSSHHTA